MMQYMEYKGYRGEAAFDHEAAYFHGDVAGIRDVITFQGRTVAELQIAFRNSIDEYLKFCAERGQLPSPPRKPETPAPGVTETV